MSDQMISGLVTVLVAIVGVATLAVLVSGQAQTSNVVKAAGSAFSGALTAAEAPVSGGGFGGASSAGNFNLNSF